MSQRSNTAIRLGKSIVYALQYSFLHCHHNKGCYDVDVDIFKNYANTPVFVFPEHITDLPQMREIRKNKSHLGAEMNVLTCHHNYETS